MGHQYRVEVGGGGAWRLAKLTHRCGGGTWNNIPRAKKSSEEPHSTKATEISKQLAGWGLLNKGGDVDIATRRRTHVVLGLTWLAGRTLVRRIIKLIKLLGPASRSGNRTTDLRRRRSRRNDGGGGGLEGEEARSCYKIQTTSQFDIQSSRDSYKIIIIIGIPWGQAETKDHHHLQSRSNAIEMRTWKGRRGIQSRIEDLKLNIINFIN